MLAANDRLVRRCEKPARAPAKGGWPVLSTAKREDWLRPGALLGPGTLAFNSASARGGFS